MQTPTSLRTFTAFVLACALGACANAPATDSSNSSINMDDDRLGTLELGNFSVSLAVKDLAASRKFYEALGFETKGGMPEQNWLILQNGTTTIGLFQGMFPNNILTFNPGWNHKAEALDTFTDVRDIQAKLEAAGLTLVQRADPDSTGVASLMVVDPDGNGILIDQHVPKPGHD